MKVPVIAVAILSLLLSQQGFAQQGRDKVPEERETAAQTYHKFLQSTHKTMVELKKVCKSEECAQLSEEGQALLADAIKKHKDGTFTPADRKELHDKLSINMMKIIHAVKENDRKNGVPETKLEKLPTACSAGKVKAAQFQQRGTEEECLLCGEVYHLAVEICSLYTIVSPSAAFICFVSASLSYMNCLDRYCWGGYVEQQPYGL